MPQLNEAFTSLGKKHCTKIVKDSGHGVSIPRLRADDIYIAAGYNSKNL